MTTAVTIAPTPILQFFNNQGQPCIGGSVLTQVGGVNATTYQDSAGTVALPNPIPLNSRGEISNSAGASCQLFLANGSTYTFTLFDANGNMLNQAATVVASNALATFIALLLTAAGATIVGFMAAFSTLLRTVQDKLRERVSAADFPGYDPTGATDSSGAINAALAASAEVEINPGETPRVSSTVVVPVGKKLTFKGGLGNSNGAYPPSHLIKDASMTTAALQISQRAYVSGGGIVCDTGNTGDGVQLLGNSAKLRDFLVHGAGGDGVRVGTNAAGGNFNSYKLDNVVSQYCGGNGINIDDGSTSTCNANAGSISNCFTQFNTGIGLALNHCFWTTVTNHLSENNTGGGVQTSGANDGGGIPKCRYPTFVGGDFNEGNGAFQINEQSYFPNWFNPDPGNCPSNAGSGLAGSGQRNVITSQGGTSLVGGTLKTNSGSEPFTLDDGVQGGMTYPLTIKKQTTAANGEGVGLAWSTSTGGAFVQSGQLRHLQFSATNWGFAVWGLKAGTISALLAIDPTTGVYPGADNTYSCGANGSRWSVVWAATGSISTSDAREKTDFGALSDAEVAVGLELPSIMKRFRWQEAVAKKGDGARWHFGWVAQDVIALFQKHGLDAFAYGACCYDKWDADELRPAGDRFSLREGELHSLVAAARARGA